MAVEIVTKDDLKHLEINLLNAFKQIVKEDSKETVKKWITTKDLEELYKISRSKQQQLRNKKAIPYTKLGETVYYSLTEIDEILEANKIL